MAAAKKKTTTRTSRTRKPTATPRRKIDRRKKTIQRSVESVQVRSLAVIFFVSLGFMMLSARLVWLGMVPVAEPETTVYRDYQEMPVRGDIYDRNGVLMATTLKVNSLYADPKMMLDVHEVVTKLAPVFDDVDWDKMEKRLSDKRRRFVWIKRRLTPSQVQMVNNMGLPGLSFRKEEARLYPHGRLASHVIGSVDVDNKGLAGVERTFDDALRKGETVNLTLDTRLQDQLRISLMEAVDRSSAKGAWGIVMNPMNGDIVALASVPDFDPNHYGAADQSHWLNKTVSGMYEMGSTFKIFTMAQGFEERVITANTALDVTAPIKIGKYYIRDSHPKYKWMTVREAFMRSSNIGASRVADSFGAEAQQAFFHKLNFMSSLETGLPQTPTPLYPSHWGRIHTMTTSFGHGIAVTPMHLVAGVSAIVGDGMYRVPRIAENVDVDEPHRVISQETVYEMREMMREVVKNGTGRNARIAGFDIGGKTGTAEKTVAGGYSKNKNLASFVGVVPLDDPKFVTLIMVDEGRIGDATGGGSIAAPAFKSFVKRATPIVGLHPVEDPSVHAVGVKKQQGIDSLFRKVAYAPNGANQP